MNVCYNGTGIKSLRRIAKILVFIAILGVLPIIIGISSNDISMLIYGILIIVLTSILSPLLKGIATIAEIGLIKKYLILIDYDIVDSTLDEIKIAEKYSGLDKQ